MLLSEKVILKICSKFTGEHPCRNAISIKLLCTFIEIALPHGCSPVNLLHILRKPFPNNTSEVLLLTVITFIPMKTQHHLHRFYKHCVKSVRIRSFSGPYFSAFGPNTERYSVSTPYLSIFSPNVGKYGPEKLRIRTLSTQ